MGDNQIVSAQEVSAGQYRIMLSRPISAGHYTTIEYVSDGSYVTYSSLPGDVGANGTSNSVDILDFIDCCLNSSCTPPAARTKYLCDLDHSNGSNSSDYLTQIDLLNGASTYIVWNNKTLSDNTCVEEQMGMPAVVESQEEQNALLADWFVNFLDNYEPGGNIGESDFVTIVETLTQWCTDHFTASERAALVENLTEPDLKFASELATGMIESIVKALSN